MGTAFVKVLKQFVAGEIAAALDNRGEPSILQIELVNLSGFAFELKVQSRAINLHVAISHRRETVRLVFARIFFIAYADLSQIHQTDHGGQYFFFGQPRQ